MFPGFVIKDLVLLSLLFAEKKSPGNIVALTILRLLINKKLKQHVRWAYV